LTDSFPLVIPTKAGIQRLCPSDRPLQSSRKSLDSRLRGNDEEKINDEQKFPSLRIFQFAILRLTRIRLKQFLQIRA
jgi:hypothetical protein